MDLRGRDLLSVRDFSAEEIEFLFQLADTLRGEPRPENLKRLPGCSLATIYQKPSTRTRVSFEAGICQLGGHALFLSSDDLQLRRGETIADTARTLSRYVDGIMIRTFDHNDVIELAGHADVPVINGLTDLLHPCQALADFYTVRRHFGGLSAGLKVAYLGDGNNVAHSLMLTAAGLGLNISLANPRGFGPDPDILQAAVEAAAASGGLVETGNNPQAAVSGASVIYTDVWASMGQEEEALLRRGVFRDFQVNDELLSLAPPQAVVMHCLPAHRGEEISDSVMDGPRSIVFEQAENRMHIQKAIMVALMG